MKTRIGFVSNSSTSSFVILGVRKPNEQMSEDDYDDALYDDDNKCYIMGKNLTHDDGCGHLDNQTFTIEELQELRTQIAAQYNVDPEIVKLHMGTVLC